MNSNTTKTVNINCPYCGEPLEIVVDCSVQRQEYIEDCEVCCQPISLRIMVAGDDNVSVEAHSDYD